MKLSQTVSQFNNRTYTRPWQDNAITNFRVQNILKLVGMGHRVLDIGCYDGSLSKLIASQGNNVVGLDISERAVRLAKKNGVEAYLMNVEESPFPKSLGKFDMIVAGEIIEHIFDPDTFLDKLYRILKPDSYLILTTPNLAGIGSRLSLLFGKLPWMIENDLLPGKSGHIRYFTFDELSKLLSRHNFQIETFTTDSIGLMSITLPLLDKFFPTLGRILIVKARKV